MKAAESIYKKIVDIRDEML